MAKFISNKERQRQLDEEKWLESEKQGFDMGGCMLYCQYCDKADHRHKTELGKCYATQDQRVADCLCAKAYNKMQKADKSK